MTMINDINRHSEMKVYISKVQEEVDRYYKTDLPNIYDRRPIVELKLNQKWAKVIYGGRTLDDQSQVFCFIDPVTGDVYKAASWNYPAKHIRGNINQENPPLTLSSLYLRH